MLAFLRKRRLILYFSGRFYRGDGTCSARFLPSYSFHLYAFIFIKGILLLSILCFNSLSRRGGKQPFRRLFGRIALFHIFFLTFAMRLPTRSSPVFMIKKSCIDKCRCKIFGRGDGTWTHDLLVPNQARYQTALHLVATSFSLRSVHYYTTFVFFSQLF